MQNSLPLSLDWEKTVKRSKHTVVVWLAAALALTLSKTDPKWVLKKDKRYFKGTFESRKDGPAIWKEFLTWELHSLSLLKTESSYLKPLDSIYIAFSTCHRQLLWNLADAHTMALCTLDFIKQAFCCIWTHGEREQLVWLFIFLWGVV